MVQLYSFFCQKSDNLRRINREAFRTNAIPGILANNQEVDFVENEKSAVCWFADKFRVRAFWTTIDFESLKGLLVSLPAGVVIESIYKDKKGDILKDFFSETGFVQYAKITKYLNCWNSNPYLVPEEGRRVLLQEMYDSTFGEFPTDEDAEELYNLNNETFDKDKDDFPSLKEWAEIIKQKHCLIHREDGAIVTYYVWKPEGKMLYSRISVNQGPANYMYNLERRIFEEYWDKGIRIFYCWIDDKNKKQHKRVNPKTEKCLKYKQRLYDAIYKKVEEKK